MKVSFAQIDRRSARAVASRVCHHIVVSTMAIACIVVAAGCRPPAMAGKKPEKVFGEQGMGPGQFVYPRAIALAPDGCLFIVDKTARVQRFNAQGDYQTGWQMPEWEAGKPVGLYVDATNRVWVADTHYHRVMVYDRDGKELFRFGSDGTGDGQFKLPTDIAINAKGEIYVGEYSENDRISRFTSDLKYIGCFGREELDGGPFMRPQSLVFDSEGMLWVADACHHRICRFTPEGKLLSQFGRPGIDPGELQYPYGLAFCPDGTLIVAEFGNNRLQRFDRTGKSLEIWGGLGRDPGRLLAPWGVVVSPEGMVYVLDSGNNRVQMFRM